MNIFNLCCFETIPIIIFDTSPLAPPFPLPLPLLPRALSLSSLPPLPSFNFFFCLLSFILFFYFTRAIALLAWERHRGQGTKRQAFRLCARRVVWPHYGGWRSEPYAPRLWHPRLHGARGKFKRERPNKVATKKKKKQLCRDRNTTQHLFQFCYVFTSNRGVLVQRARRIEVGEGGSGKK